MRAEQGMNSPEGLRHVVPNRITARQGKILSLAAEGMINSRISSTLGISYRTVESHLTSAYSRLQVSNRTQAVLRAARYRMITLPELSDVDIKRIQTLTPRELEVAHMISLYDGAYSSAENLAKHLEIATSTVDRHRDHIQQKLETENITQVAVKMVLYDAKERPAK